MDCLLVAERFERNRMQRKILKIVGKINKMEAGRR
jgi:hypothetical protein